jgi:hypothetical protein
MSRAVDLAAPAQHLFSPLQVTSFFVTESQIVTAHEMFSFSTSIQTCSRIFDRAGVLRAQSDARAIAIASWR